MMRAVLHIRVPPYDHMPWYFHKEYEHIVTQECSVETCALMDR